ncbi:hypothetical protein M404DRAFT_22426 [Pisolithus tinctorius Marx 270]|uniref:Uncharacterized protein n=1 Tax=Pisolithus tinctorius Marx 270 TaxID=870435 RepID=A0A0C3PKQ2_PISTI|nr:hypothetical protein M404DRAFT_22426 [Pisolithus tinctorius Marx 270]
MNHIESKVIARRIRVEEPSRLVIRRKPPEGVLRIEMLKHAARIDALTLEIFQGRTVSAIYVLFKHSSSESTCTLGIRTCAESPAMLTKRSHVTALRVVAACTQVLHTDNYSVTGWLRKIATIEGYEEWGEQRTVWKLPRLRATATAARTTAVATRATATATTTLLSAGKRPYKVGGAVRWERCATSADTELDGSEVRFDFETPYLHLCYSREGNYLRRTATIAIQATTTVIALSADQRPGKIGCAVLWRQGATSACTGLDGPGFCFDFIAFYLQRFYTRDNGYRRRRPKEIQTIVIQRTTTTLLSADQWPRESGSTVRRRWGAKSADTELDGSSVCFDFGTFYLQLPYSRKNGRARRCSSYIQAAGIRWTAMTYEESQWTVKGKLCEAIRQSYYEWGEQSGQAQTLQFKLHRQSSRIRRLTSIDMVPDGSDDVIEEARDRYTARRLRQLRDARREVIKGILWTSAQVLLRTATRRRSLELQQDTQEARGIEAMPSGLEGPKFSFFFGVLYLRLRCFREYKPSQSIDESSSSDVPVVRREIWYLRGSASDVQVARVRGWEVTYEKGQQTVGVKRRDAAQRCYYEWGEWVQYTRGRMLTLQCSIEGKEMFNDEGREAARRILAMTTGLDVDRQPHKIGSVIRWRRSTMGTDPELDSSNFRFDFKMLYLRLRYSRGNRYLRRSATTAREPTKDYEHKALGHTAKQVR